MMCKSNFNHLSLSLALVLWRLNGRCGPFMLYLLSVICVKNRCYKNVVTHCIQFIIFCHIPMLMLADFARMALTLTPIKQHKWYHWMSMLVLAENDELWKKYKSPIHLYETWYCGTITFNRKEMQDQFEFFQLTFTVLLDTIDAAWKLSRSEPSLCVHENSDVPGFSFMVNEIYILGIYLCLEIYNFFTDVNFHLEFSNQCLNFWSHCCVLWTDKSQ